MNCIVPCDVTLISLIFPRQRVSSFIPPEGLAYHSNIVEEISISLEINRELWKHLSRLKFMTSFWELLLNFFVLEKFIALELLRVVLFNINDFFYESKTWSLWQKILHYIISRRVFSSFLFRIKLENAELYKRKEVH